MKKVVLENIVTIRDDDYTTLCCALDPEYDPEGSVAAWIDEDDLLDFLLSWWYPGEHETAEYNYEDINTPFLGNEKRFEGERFLLNHDSGLGIASLSRILEIKETDDDTT